MTFNPAQCRDFCLWPYEPPVSPAADALDGAAPLLAAAAQSGCEAEWVALIKALRRGLGDYATVWGVKQDGAALSVELYFYDYARQRRRVSLARVLATLDGFVRCPVTLDEAIPYFMVSLDLPLAPGAFPHVLPAVDVYIGNPGSSVSSGICYRVDDAGAAELKNFYFFFDRKREWPTIQGKLECGMRAGCDAHALKRLLPDWLRDCRTIVVANKRAADGLYVSRIGTPVLARFLRDFAGQPALAGTLEQDAPRYQHLLFDVGYDFTLQDGVATPGKCSWYGVV